MRNGGPVGRRTQGAYDVVQCVEGRSGEVALAGMGSNLNGTLLLLKGSFVSGNVTGSRDAEGTTKPDATEITSGEALPKSGRPDSNRRRPAWEAGILPLNYAREHR